LPALSQISCESRAEFQECSADFVQTPLSARASKMPLLPSLQVDRFIYFARWFIHMMRRIGIICLWLLASFLIFICSNLYDPYLVMMRGQGKILVLIASFVTVGLLVIGGALHRKGIAGKLLVLMWCLPPLAMLSAEAVFQLRKQAVLRADGQHARDLGRHFIVGYSSFDDVAPLAAKGLIGGIYVTRHNIRGKAPDALKSEIANLQAMRRVAGLAPLIVAADQEGGIVSHLSPQLTSLPALSSLAKLPADKRARMAENFGQIHGHELASLGITLNFAPVVDLLRVEPRNRFDFNSLISRRAISEDPEIVAEIAGSYARGLESAGIGATVKHFPGLGRVREDTHHFRARLDTAVNELNASDWIPFRKALAQSNASLMVGHVAVTAIDAERAASHSRRVVNDLIREQWGYQGIIITDDLVMGAIYQNGICTAVVEALNAGVDLLLVAFDGLQFYRVYDCALAASAQGRLSKVMLEKSAARLEGRRPDSLAGAGMSQANPLTTE
jgi:beta-N-acetylhexosaminidase